MTDDSVDRIESIVRQTWPIRDESRVDVADHGEGRFQSTEVGAEDGVRLRVLAEEQGILGFQGVRMEQEPELTFEQARVFNAVWADFQRKISAAEREGAAEVRLMREGEHSELFPSTRADRMNIPGSVADGMLPAWISVEQQARLRGYRILKMQRGGTHEDSTSPFELVARPASRVHGAW